MIILHFERPLSNSFPLCLGGCPRMAIFMVLYIKAFQVYTPERTRRGRSGQERPVP